VLIKPTDSTTLCGPEQSCVAKEHAQCPFTASYIVDSAPVTSWYINCTGFLIVSLLLAIAYVREVDASVFLHQSNVELTNWTKRTLVVSRFPLSTTYSKTRYERTCCSCSLSLRMLVRITQMLLSLVVKSTLYIVTSRTLFSLALCINMNELLASSVTNLTFTEMFHVNYILHMWKFTCVFRTFHVSRIHRC